MRPIKMASLAVLLLSTCLAVPPSLADAADEAAWHTAHDFQRDIKKTEMRYALFSPKTPNWRMNITSSKNSDKGLSSIQVVVFEDRVEIHGKKTALRKMIGSPFKGNGGDSKTLTFNNGLAPDGTPNKFRIEITGTNVNVDVAIQDQRAEPSSKEKSDKKGKKK